MCACRHCPLSACPHAGPAAAPTCDLLLKLYPLRQPLLSRHATDALTALCAAPGNHLSAKGLAELLGAVLASEQLWERRDADTTVSAIRLLEDGFCRLAEADASLCAQRLPRTVHTLVPQLAAEQESVRFAAGACLKNILNEGVDDGMVAAALAGGGKQPAPLLSVLAALEGLLGAHYQDAWDSCLPGGGGLGVEEAMLGCRVVGWGAWGGLQQLLALLCLGTAPAWGLLLQGGFLVGKFNADIRPCCCDPPPPFPACSVR